MLLLGHHTVRLGRATIRLLRSNSEGGVQRWAATRRETRAQAFLRRAKLDYKTWPSVLDGSVAQRAESGFRLVENFTWNHVNVE